MNAPFLPRLTTSPRSLQRPPQWPDQLLDVAALRDTGWRPTAFREFVLKVHQLCNLACDYCYVYELADQSWRDRPRLMSPEIWRAAAGRIADHVREHQLDRIGIVLHGGEPLLAGPDRLLELTTDLRAAVPAGCAVSVGIQTNGVQLDEATIERLTGHGISIGVSLDGTAADHDRHRTFKDGRGSHARVDRALRLLSEPPYRRWFAGLLCTVDVTTDPIAAYEALLAYRPPGIDFLLPHANWATPPAPGAGQWLITVFDRWYDAPRRPTGIRLFEEVMSLVLGGSSRSEQVGLSPVAVAVVESDGSIEQVDSLKSTYPGACATGTNVLTDPFDTALGHPGVVARQIGVRALSDDCLQCPIHRVCGGGHYAHRYDPASGFRNPTVYCAEMQLLIGHISRRVAADLARLRAAA